MMRSLPSLPVPPPPPPPRPSPCDRDSEMYAKAYDALANEDISNLEMLKQNPPPQVVTDANKFGISPADLIERYVRCLQYHTASAPPMDGGRRRSRKYKNRRRSRSKRSKRSRRRN
jgi:hypothetical protein